ncbi:hypothetical protein UFOVP256_4 [uncultured Caudovirales phage]|uniref:Uncharacterized protein n=1 Tax=uncultured Caudovirales phage TaxID=2100421 RepID=A0A6J5LG67_9CAUD|nr:hypothetical protein UFOVP256_4 [uncultured Caudovirales phage]
MSTQLMMSTAAGELHGLINTLTNSVPFDDFKNFKPEHKKEMERQKKEDSKIVEAEYMNSRGKHERLTKPYCKYAGDPIQIWHFIPGKTYKVPLGLVKEVNDSTKKIPRRSGLVSIDGESVRKDESPLDKDEEGEWLHKFVSHGW